MNQVQFEERSILVSDVGTHLPGETRARSAKQEKSASAEYSRLSSPGALKARSCQPTFRSTANYPRPHLPLLCWLLISFILIGSANSVTQPSNLITK